MNLSLQKKAIHLDSNIDYLNFIRKNKNFIEKEKAKNRYSNYQIHDKPNYTEFKKKKPYEGFTTDPNSYNLDGSKPPSQYLTSDQLLNLVEKKNNEIKNSLQQQKQSLSEVFYTNYRKEDLQSRRNILKKPYEGKTELRFPSLNHQKKKSHDKKEEALSLQATKPPYQSTLKQRHSLFLQSTNELDPAKNVQAFYKVPIKTYYDFENSIEVNLHNTNGFMPVFKPSLKAADQKKIERNTDGEEGAIVLTQLKQQYLKIEELKTKKSPSKESKEQQVLTRKMLQKNVSRKQILGLEQSPSIQEEPEEAEVVKKKKKKQLKERIDKDQPLYFSRIREYREYLFLINLSHRVHESLQLKDPYNIKPDEKYKFFIGRGNNSLLIKSLMKRRFWWAQEDDSRNANFVWTQLKINSYYQYQKTNQNRDMYYDDIVAEKPKKDKAGQRTSSFRAPDFATGQLKVCTGVDMDTYQTALNGVDNGKMPGIASRKKLFPPDFWESQEGQKKQVRVHNHFPNNFYMGNKKALFHNLRHYYQLQGKNVFDIIPLTFHIKNGSADPEYSAFVQEYENIHFKIKRSQERKKQHRNVWIVKPGEHTNCGRGITVVDEVYELNTILKKKEKHTNGELRTYIVQKYIERPFLYKGRKFDIRHYLLVSRLHGKLRAYWHAEGYIRTSSFEYNIEDIGDEEIHLTNDAIQKHSTFYGKYEEGNKLSYNQFQRYLDQKYPEKKYSFGDSIYPQMKKIGLESMAASYLFLDPEKHSHNFEIFGLDFMIDSNFKVWLIEINTNPCLELSSKLLERVIPTMVEHALRLTIDAVFPPFTHYPNSQKHLVPDRPLDKLQFQLIFDEDRDGSNILQLYKQAHKDIDIGKVDEDEETYDNDGKEIDLDMDTN